LRALAIGLVIIAHFLFLPPTQPAGRSFLPRPLAAVLEHGWLGVDLFFVLSGFLITSILLRTKGLGRGTYFRTFYERRALRILPLYFVVLFVLVIADRGRDLPYFALCAGMAANWAGPANVSVPDMAGPFWSLAVEEQFYLFWPWLVLWLDERRLATVAIALLVAEPILRAYFAGNDQLTWLRADGLAMGSLVALWYATWNGERRGPRDLIGALLGTLALAIVAGAPFGGLQKGLVGDAMRISEGVLLFGAMLVAAISYQGSPVLRPLRARPLVYVALVSYCVYLVHRPVLLATDAILAHAAWFAALSPVPETLTRSIVALAFVFAIAACSRRWLEVPFLRIGRRPQRVRPSRDPSG